MPKDSAVLAPDDRAVQAQILRLLTQQGSKLDGIVEAVTSLRTEMDSRFSLVQAQLRQDSPAVPPVAERKSVDLVHCTDTAQAVRPVSTGGRRKLAIQDEEDSVQETQQQQQQPAPTPRRQRTKLAIQDEDEEPPAPCASKEEEDNGSALRAVLEVRSSAETSKLGAGLNRAKASPAQDEGLPEVNPSDWMTNRRSAPAGQTFHPYGRGAFTAEEQSSSSEEEEDWRATRRAMKSQEAKPLKPAEAPSRPVKESRKTVSFAAPTPAPAPAPAPAPVPAPVPAPRQRKVKLAIEEVDDTEEEDRLTRIEGEARALEEQSAATRRKQLEREKKLTLRREEEAQQLERAAAQRKQMEDAIQQAREDRLVEEAAAAEEQLAAVEEEKQEALRQIEEEARRKEDQRAKLQEQARKRAERKAAEAEQRAQEEVQLRERQEAERELLRVRESARAEECARRAAEVEAAAVRAEQEAFQQEEMRKLAERLEGELREHNELVAKQKAQKLESLRLKVLKQPVVHQLCHEWVSDDLPLAALPPKLWTSIQESISAESDELYSADVDYSAAQKKYAVMQVQIAQSCVLSEILGWVLSSVSLVKPEVYPAVPELPGRLVGMMLSQNPAGESVLMVGLELEVESVQDEMHRIVLHDLLSGQALDAVRAAAGQTDKKSMLLTDIARVLKCKQGHPLQMFAQPAALYLDSSDQNQSAVSPEYSVSMIKPHCLQDSSKLVAMLSHLYNTGLALVGARMLWPDASDQQKLSCFSPHTPTSSEPTVVLAVRGINAVSEWLKAIGPDDPTLARRTDPASLRALHGTDRANNLLVCTRSESRSTRDVALFFGGRCTPEYDHSLTVKLIKPFQPNSCVITVRHELSTARYAQLLSSLAGFQLTVQQISRVEPSQGLAVQLDLCARRALLLLLSGESARCLVQRWLQTAPHELSEHMTLCVGDADVEARNCIVHQLPGKSHAMQAQNLDDTDGEQTVMAIIVGAAPIVLQGLMAAAPDASLMALKLVRSVPGWALSLIQENTTPAVLSGRLHEGCLVLVMRGFGLRESLKAVQTDSVMLSTTAAAAAVLLPSLLHATEIELPKPLISIEALFAAAPVEQTVLCVKGAASNRQLPKVLKLLRINGFHLQAAQLVRYATVQTNFEKIHVPAQPEAMATLLLLQRSNGIHKLASLLDVHSNTSLAAIFGEDSFRTAHNQHQATLVTRLCSTSKGIDMAGSRCVLKRAPSLCETICVLLSPELTETGRASLVLDRALREGYTLVGVRMLCLSQPEAVHYGSLSKHNTEGLHREDQVPCTVLALQRDNGLAHFASILGNETTSVSSDRNAIWKLQHASLREQFGAANVLSSSSLERARKELALFYGELYGQDQIGAAML